MLAKHSLLSGFGTHVTHEKPDNASRDVTVESILPSALAWKSALPLCLQAEGQQIPAEFTYSVTWRETTVPFEKRMDKYRRYQFLPQHLEVRRRADFIPDDQLTSSTQRQRVRFCMA